MKVYNLKDGSVKDHHAVDAREIVRERPTEFSLQNPKAPPGEEVVFTPVPADKAKEAADKAAANARALSDAKAKALKLRDVAVEAARVAGTAPAAAKKAATATAEAAEKEADEADSEVARLEAGGEALPQKVVLK